MQLGQDEDKPPLDDVWDGINFMVDNETGKFPYAIFKIVSIAIV